MFNHWRKNVTHTVTTATIEISAMLGYNRGLLDSTGFEMLFKNIVLTVNRSRNTGRFSFKYLKKYTSPDAHKVTR